ncbi:cadherin-like protein 26 [Lates japonicus]|uniref:Cadherin-like protein 26 n=1 Tax=Lates japonicus TaxID=270547 RepID=A0AAD3RB24_LATJO|nr:cadherin-like protein 26 [Lates japonicus]
MLCFFLLVSYLSSTTCSEVLSRHRRTWIIDSFTIEEGHPGPFPYVLGKISVDRNHLVYFDLYGEGVDEDPKGVISIHKESGTLSVHKPVDYEEKTKLMLKFEARKTDSSIDTKLGVEISIRDINDNPPRFQRDLYEISIDEKNTQGSHLLTVVAYDRDQRGTPNSTFHYEIKSVSPNPPDTEFFIDESGTISFKGCLDHEVAEMFTILVEAKDHGEVISLSSSTTVVIHVRDGNNQIPTISGQTGTGKVNEDETGSSPLRLHVTDKDTPNSPAWRARYTIKGDDGEHFKIETDPDTNDGILTVVKPLDFEEGAKRELSISVENEAPYFSCKVKERTSSGLWTVDTSEGDGPGAGQPHSVNVIITVEDANDPPVFSVAVKEAVLEENAPVGTWIEKVTAVDPDSTHARDFVYKVGSDPAGWVTVDPQTGDITTVKTPDRESPHVINGVYTVLLHAEDDGYTAGLVKEPRVYAGPHTIDLKISDMQGKFGVYNLSVTVCDCSVRANCRTRGASNAKATSGAIGVVFAALLLLLVLLLMAVVCTCKKKFATLEADSSGETLLVSNTENPGTDCKVPDGVMAASADIKHHDPSKWQSLHDGMQHTHFSTKDIEQNFMDQHFTKRNYRRENLSNLLADEWNQTTWNSFTAKDYHHTHQFEDMSTMKCINKGNLSYASDVTLLSLLHWKLSSLQETEGNLLDYEPHLYADEGDSDILTELENIAIPDDDSFPKALTDLGPKFNQLASICRPQHIQN